MSTSTFTHDTNWMATSIVGSMITNQGSITSSAITSSGKIGTEIGVECTYAAGTIATTSSCVVYIIRSVSASLYEAVTDFPYGRAVPNQASSTTRRMTMDVPGSVSDFKLLVANDSNVGVTASLWSRQSVITTV